MDKSTHEEQLSQTLQSNIKQYKLAITFLNGYNGILNVTNSNIKFYSMKTITDADDFNQITISPGTYETESLNNEIKRIVIDKGHYSENEYPFTIKPKFSTLGSIIDTSPTGPIIIFVFNDSIRNLLGFYQTILFKEYNLSPFPVDILTFDNIFLECDIAKGMTFEGKRSGIVHNFTMDVDLGYKDIELFSGGNTWYMTETKDVISSFFSN